MIRINIDQSEIEDFCRRSNIRRLAFFGSVLREDFRPDSDVDVLVEFEPQHVPGLAFFSLEAELSRLLGRKVDLNTPQFLSPEIRSLVEQEAEIQYEQA
ncbi:MAG: nucleotidyltransferase family protein [Acidobacteria bacterium]|nr:nucleotidyltransferase family protein [Acidobacteriota bacterium]